MCTDITIKSQSGKTVIAAAETKKILGAQLLCERATDMISEFATAIVNERTLEQVRSIIHPHPTYNGAIGSVYGNFLTLSKKSYIDHT